MALQGVDVQRVMLLVLVLIGVVGVGFQMGLLGGGGSALGGFVFGGAPVGGSGRDDGGSDRGDDGPLPAEVVG